MTRVFISNEELGSWLTTELRRNSGCEDVFVIGITKLYQPDEDGCNWSDQLTVRNGGVFSDYFWSDLQKIVQQGRLKFNLK